MRRSFVGNLFILLLLNFLIKPFWLFGIDRTVQNTVGEEAYGRYFALIGFTIVFNIILDAGLTHYNNQSVAKRSGSLQENFTQLLSLKMLLGLIYLVVTLVIGALFGYADSNFMLLLVLTINQFLASMILFLRSNISGLQMYRLDALLSVVDKSITILFCSLLLFTPVLGRAITVMDFALTQSLSYVLTTFLALAIVLRKGGINNYSFRVRKHGKNLKRAFPYALLILLMALYTRIDSVMLDLMVGPYYVGVYVAAFRLVDAVNQVGYLFAVLLLPLFANLLSKKIDVSPLIELNFNLILAGTMAVSLACFFYAEPLMQFLSVGAADLSATVLRLLILSTIAFGSTFIFGTLLTASGDLKVLNIIALCGFVLNIILNFILIKQHQAYGAAIATVVTQFATAIIQLIVSLRLFKVKFSVSAYWLRVLLFSLGAIFLAIVVNGLDFIEWPYRFAMIIVVTLFFSSIVGFFKLKEAIELVGQRFR
jgi:O-antigen/teichoic acid export membrane protein